MPIVQWSCQPAQMVCEIPQADQTMSCCDTTSTIEALEMSCCSNFSSRVLVSSADLSVQNSTQAPKIKIKEATLAHMWFNSNYLSDYKNIDLNTITAFTTQADGLKYQSLDRLLHICIARI